MSYVNLTPGNGGGHHRGARLRRQACLPGEDALLAASACGRRERAFARLRSL